MLLTATIVTSPGLSPIILETTAFFGVIFLAFLAFVGQARGRARHEEALLAFDQLTGLASRHELESRLDASSAEQLGIVVFDVDRFEEVNHRLGAAGVDEALVALAGIARRTVGEGATVARVGDDDFVVALPKAGPLETSALARRVCAAVKTEAASFDIRASVGWAAGRGGRTLWSAAETSLGRAQALGGGCSAGPERDERLATAGPGGALLARVLSVRDARIALEPVYKISA